MIKKYTLITNKYIFKTILATLVILSIIALISGLLEPSRRNFKWMIMFPIRVTGIFSLLTLFELFIFGSLTKKIDLSISSLKEVLFWTIISVYGIWSLFSFIIFDLIKVSIISYTIDNIVLFIILFTISFNLFFILYKALTTE